MSTAGLPAPAPAATLVGREREQAALRAALDAALAGRGSLVLIGGEAGIGKTALAEALCREATAQGALALVGRCYDLAETPPFGPWTELFRRAAATGELRAPLVGLIAGQATGITSQAALVGEARDYLAALVAARPLVLLLDDLHWADPASLDLLRILGRDLNEQRILLLATYRADEITRRHPLYALLPALVREADATRRDLHPLTDADTAALVRARYPLPAADATRLTTYLQRQAEGNPFYAGEVLRTLEEEGLLSLREGNWSLAELGAASVPTLLRQVIDARLARLGEEARGVLAEAAIIGQEVPLALWQAVSGASDETLLDMIERAAEARVLEPTAAGARFAHALIREALYEGTLPLRRRAWHRRVAEALVATSPPDPDAVAYHFQQADDPRAVDWLLAAADRAEGITALATAVARLEAALQLLERAGAPAAERGWLLCRLATDCYGTAARQRGIAALAEAAQLAAEAGDRQLAMAVRGYQSEAHFQSGDARRGLAELMAAVADDPGPPPADARITRLLGRREWTLYATGRFPGRLALWLASSGRYAEVPSLAARLMAHQSSEAVMHPPFGATSPVASLALGRAHAALGEPDAARRALAQAREGFGAMRSWTQAGMIIFDELWHVALPYATDAPAAHDALLAAFARLPVPVDIWELVRVGLRAPLLLLAGRWQEARAAAEALLLDDFPFFVKSYARQPLGWLAAAQGDGALLETQLLEVLPDGPATEPGDSVFRTAVELQRAAATLALAANDLPLARVWLDAHGRWLAWSGSVLGRAEGALGWAAYHRTAGDPARAREHAERALAHAAEPRQPLALLAAHRLLGELDTEAGRHAEAAGHLAEALALAEACAAPYERALTLLALAALRLTTGARDEAGRSLVDARTLLAPLAARPALARADALAGRLAAAPAAPPAHPAGLSAREAEVLRLVAAGMTNAQVAERLFLSPRTVGQHLRSIYNKLGVDNRTAAAHFATDHGLA